MPRLIREVGVFSKGLLGGALAFAFGFASYWEIYSVFHPNTWVGCWASSVRLDAAMLLVFAVGFYAAIRGKLSG